MKLKPIRIIKSEIYFPIIIGLHLVMWSIDLHFYQGSLILSEGENPYQRILGEIMSSWVITVLGFTLLMATRARWVERVFGGLDKMYLIHRRSGMIALVLLFLHFGIVPRHPVFTVGKPLGFIAIFLILIGVMLSAAPLFKRRIPYHKWLGIHRLLGPIYVIGVFHAFTVSTLISKLPVIRTYVFGMAFMGVTSWIYRVFLHLKLHPRFEYQTVNAEQLSGSVLSVEMAPAGSSIAFTPGQFGFFSFPGINDRESHPFTIASHPSQSNLRIAIKATGDFTTDLQSNLEVGDPVLIEGPYGKFIQTKDLSSNQIWIAGGIGITPFLSFAHDLTGTGRGTTLYWSVRSQEEACYDEELRELAEKIPELTYRLWISNRDGFLTADQITVINQSDKPDIFICGPEALRDTLTFQLKRRGIPSRNIHSEEFAFR